MNRDHVRERLKIEGKVFVGAWAGYTGIAAISGVLTFEVLAIRFGMAVVTALLIGAIYRGRTKSARFRRSRILWAIVIVVALAFVVGRLVPG
jgi:hypothetical protein